MWSLRRHTDWGLRRYLPQGHPDEAKQIGLEESLDVYLARLVAVFDEVRRVLRDDGTCWVNLGDSYASNWPCNRPNVIGSGSLPNGKREARPPRMNEGLKEKDLCLVPERFALAMQARGWWVRSRIALCLSGGARVYARTQKGDMPTMVKDLVRLRPNTVELWNGERWTRCTHFTQNPRPSNPIEIELLSGERIGCTPDHVWPTTRGNVSARELKIGDVILMSSLPAPDDLEDPEMLPSEEIGWFIGVYMAEGFQTDKAIIISGHVSEKEMWERLSALAKKYHGTVWMKKPMGSGTCAIIHSHVLSAIVNRYVYGHGAKEKRLTNACWMRSNAFLLALLRGYLEGDGYYRAKDLLWSISFTQNDEWAAQLRTICARLRLPLILRRHLHLMGDRTFPGYRGYIRFTWKDSAGSRAQRKERGTIKALRPSRARQFWDIGVEDEPHLFALASGVLTHNCKLNPMPESVLDRPTSAWEHLWLFSKSARYFYDAEAVKTPTRETSLARLAQNVEAQEGSRRANGEAKVNGPMKAVGDASGANMRNWIAYATEALSEPHYAAFPKVIPRTAIRAGTSARGCCPACGAPWVRVTETTGERMSHGGSAPRTKILSGGHGKGSTSMLRDGATAIRHTVGWEPSCACGRPDPVPATVLDPFLGSGTVAVVAIEEDRAWVGIELNEEYCRIAESRIAKAGSPQIGLAL